MKKLTALKNFFSFNRRELNGIAALSTLVFLVFLAGRLVPMMTAGTPIDTTGLAHDARLLGAMIRYQDSLDSAARKNRYVRKKWEDWHSPSPAWDSAQKYPSAKKAIRVELNTADSFDLQQLRGIGPGYARRIIRYRERLGGFIDKRQLLEVYGMDTGRYNGIAASVWISADTVKRINLNEVEFKRLLSHPYFPFEITKAIILYRTKKKKIRSVEELTGIPGMSDSLYRKMLPYIRLE